MLLFVTIIHIIVAVLLITLVLLQDSKGGGVFGMGSSGSNQVLSATGATNFFVKATRTLAIVFAVTCLTLTYMTSKKSSDSVIDGYVPTAAPATTPANPAEATAPTADPKAAERAPEQKSENK